MVNFSIFNFSLDFTSIDLVERDGKPLKPLKGQTCRLFQTLYLYLLLKHPVHIWSRMQWCQCPEGRILPVTSQHHKTMRKTGSVMYRKIKESSYRHCTQIICGFGIDPLKALRRICMKKDGWVGLSWFLAEGGYHAKVCHKR